jgi:hypothetical protein
MPNLVLDDPFCLKAAGDFMLLNGLLLQRPPQPFDHCPAMVCLQAVSVRIDQGCILVYFLRPRRRAFAMTSRLRMIAVIASFFHFPDATN